MFITDKEKLKKYTKEHRIWQGIPGIEVTKGGRCFLTFYSGGIKETLGNYVMLLSGEENMTEIAYACGFSTASYFAERFTKSEGMTPTEYRKLHR
ncbi:MAG: helix-turn-helix transcriptional regulator [Ruminococcaceae bacterium]|nr:helix-turn-helix transcriptional regulator [Oscillospiraceae bacterium]